MESRDQTNSKDMTNGFQMYHASRESFKLKTINDEDQKSLQSKDKDSMSETKDGIAQTNDLHGLSQYTMDSIQAPMMALYNELNQYEHLYEQ